MKKIFLVLFAAFLFCNNLFGQSAYSSSSEQKKNAKEVPENPTSPKESPYSSSPKQNKSLKNFSVGDIISSSTGEIDKKNLALSNVPYDEKMIAVVKETSSDYGTSLEFVREGEVYVKVDNSNVEIKKGDYVTSAGNGKAMKATQSGMIIGIALEDAASSSGLIKIRVMIQYVKQ